MPNGRGAPTSPLLAPDGILTPRVTALALPAVNGAVATAALPEPPVGYDRRKWFDLNHRSVKYVFGRAFAQTFPAGIHEAAALIGATVLPAGVGKPPDSILLGPGEGAGRIIDVIFAVGSPQQHQQWTDVTEEAQAAPIAPWAPPVVAAPSPRTEVLNAAENFLPTESSPQLAIQQRRGNYRASLSTGASLGSFTDGAAWNAYQLPGATVESLPPHAAGLPPASGGPGKPKSKSGVGKFFGAIGKGLKSVGKGIGKAVTSKAGLATIGAVGASLFIPGVGAVLGSGLGTIGKTALKGVKIAGGALAKGTRAAIVAASKTGGQVSIPELSIQQAAGMIGSTASVRSSIAASIGSAAGQLLGGYMQARTPPFIGEDVYAPSTDAVYSLDWMLQNGFIPDETPFYMQMVGSVETVIGVDTDAQGIPVFILHPDGYVVDLITLIQLEYGV